MLKRNVLRAALMTGSVLGVTSMAMAHGQLLSPNGGEIIEAGSTFTIEWMVLVPHDLEEWELRYSTEGPDGPWVDIALGIEAGSPEPGVSHFYDWAVPDDIDDESVWVQVAMINSGEDYLDSSDDPFSIVAPPCVGDIDGSGAVDVTDLLDLLASWGSCDDCASDITGDGVVDVSDLLEMLAHWGACG